jgi:hypothetical protein
MSTVFFYDTMDKRKEQKACSVGPFNVAHNQNRPFCLFLSGFPILLKLSALYGEDMTKKCKSGTCRAENDKEKGRPGSI